MPSSLGAAAARPRHPPPNYQPPQNPRPAANVGADGRSPAIPDDDPPPQWPGPRWTPASAAVATAWHRRAYPGNNFQDPGVNPFENPSRDPFSTFAMDVDTASYAVARRYIEDGNMPDRDSVRLEEFVNAFDYGYAPPTSDAFAINVDGAPAPFVDPRSVLLRIGIQARAVPRAAARRRGTDLRHRHVRLDGRRRPPRNGQALARAARLAPAARRLDRHRPVQTTPPASSCKPTSAAEPGPILDAIAQLQPRGSTNAQAGLELGFDLALQMLRPGVSDRVIIASDGVANVGLTDRRLASGAHRQCRRVRAST